MKLAESVYIVISHMTVVGIVVAIARLSAFVYDGVKTVHPL